MPDDRYEYIELQLMLQLFENEAPLPSVTTQVANLCLLQIRRLGDF